jgi:AcrR family transcriptional regulator
MAKGRRPGKPNTKAEILASARAEFAVSGYERATIRSIASLANVDPALVMHYFGSKEQLFAASLELPVNPATVMRQVFEATDCDIGEILIRTMLTVWDTDVGGGQFIAALRSATSVGPINETVREFIHRSILETIADALEGPGADLRASLIASQLVGLLVGRYVLQFPALVEASVDELAASVGPTIGRYASV